MLLTYLAVRKTEKASSKWKSSNNATSDASKYEPMNSAMRKKKEKEESDRKHSKQVSSQAFYYLLAFFFSWTPATLTRFIQMIWSKTYYPLILLWASCPWAICTPMQGFLNYLVYMRPRWMSYRKRHPEWGRCMAVAMIFRGEFNKQTESMGVDGGRASTGRGWYFSAIGRRTSAFGKSSISRQGSNDIAESAELVSGEHKEEDRRDNSSEVENGNNVSVIPEESSLQDDDEDVKKDGEAAAAQ